MDVTAFLRELCALPGHPGMEGAVAERVAQEFGKYSTQVSIDTLGNVTAVMGSEDGPTVLLCAHMDEVGLIATGFDEKGGIRIGAMGGVDPRILPGSEVRVYGRETLFGIIGAKPPHLSAGTQKAPEMDKLVVDVGLPAEQVKKLVQVGDPISFAAPVTELANGRIAGKTFDDRACVASLAAAMEQLSKVALDCRVVFAATVAEEVGSRGAKTAAYTADPDLAIALDVTHGPMPGADSSDVFALDSVVLSRGPVIHPALYTRLSDTAKKLGIKTETEVSARLTYTDGDELQIARSGIPTGLISVPLSYMHTPVETISVRTVEEAGRLLAGFLQGVNAGWEEWLCYKD